MGMLGHRKAGGEWQAREEDTRAGVGSCMVGTGKLLVTEGCKGHVPRQAVCARYVLSQRMCVLGTYIGSCMACFLTSHR